MKRSNPNTHFPGVSVVVLLNASTIRHPQASTTQDSQQGGGLLPDPSLNKIRPAGLRGQHTSFLLSILPTFTTSRFKMPESGAGIQQSIPDGASAKYFHLFRFATLIGRIKRHHNLAVQDMADVLSPRTYHTQADRFSEFPDNDVKTR